MRCLFDRSGTPLLYRAIPSWMVRVTPIVDDLVKNNKETRWYVILVIGASQFV